MATPELGIVGADDPLDGQLPPAVSSLDRGRRLRGIVGQYALLIALSVVVLGPLLLTLIQAMSSPFAWVFAGKPLHPVQVDWKDRTWFTGGAFSVVARTLVVVAFFAWFHRVTSGRSWKQWREFLEPAPLVSILGTSVAFTVLLGPTYRSFHEVDGNSQWWVIATMAVVAATLVPGLLAARSMSPPGAVVAAVAVAVLTVGAAVIFVGAEAWTQTWESARLGPAMRQSLKMAVLITVLQVVTSITSAYAFVFLDFPFKRVVFALFMGTLLLPLEVTLVGNVALIRQLGWINTTQGLVLPFAATALGTFLVRQGFKGIPPEIRDACRLDGYGHLAFLTKFAVPLTRPVIAAFTVISALGAWNQYLWPRAIIDNDRYSTLQIQLRTIVGENVADANLSIAAALVAAVPVLLLLVAFQRQIIRGLTAGAVK
jgi:sn-glycerol 3-phosphate transport system permease protein